MSRTSALATSRMLICRAAHPLLCKELQHSRPWIRDLQHTNLPCTSPPLGFRLFPRIVTLSRTSALATSRTLTCRAPHPPLGSDSLPASSLTPNSLFFFSVARSVNNDFRIRNLGHANLPDLHSSFTSSSQAELKPIWGNQTHCPHFSLLTSHQSLDG